MKLVFSLLRIFILFLLFNSILQSCSLFPYVVSITPDYEGVDEDLKPYVNKVKGLSNNCLGNIKYAGFFKKPPKHIEDDYVIAGMANWILPFFEPQIHINRDSWNSFSENQKVILIAHELYHAEKPFIGHHDKEDDWGCAEHFMHPSIQSSWCIYINYNNYIKQMRDCK